jgi:uncharacterized protein (DUF488 family)
MPQIVFTIGHSTHSLDHFTSLLSLHSITVLCDVRSTPYSQINPHFNREDLKSSLLAAGVRYVFLGRELGARSDDLSCYENGKVRYDRIAKTLLFRQGLERLQQGATSYRVALMCAEKEPLQCHRTILVSRYVTELGFNVQHILPDGSLEMHAAAMDRLVKILNLRQGDLFRPLSDIYDVAYRLQEDRIAFKLDDAKLDGAVNGGSFAS